MSKGAYILLIHVPETRLIEVGRLGTFPFQEGTYLYVGSALHSLENRVARHLSKTKKVRWHIDFLLQYAEVRNVLMVNAERRIECALNRVVCETAAVEAPVKGFGSSDCHCLTHLWRSAVRRDDEKTSLETERMLAHLNQAVQRALFPERHSWTVHDPNLIFSIIRPRGTETPLDRELSHGGYRDTWKTI